MAKRRMFTKDITNSSRFLMMSLSAQALYFQLGMNADDDGYVEHFTVMRMIGGNPDDLKILAAKNFIKVFDDHVLIIIDWERHNKIQPSRKIPSQYIDVYDRLTKCQQITDNVSEQVRLGKVRLGKVNKENNKKKVPAEELPDWLDKKAWAEWVQHRKEIKKKLTPSTISAQLKKLEKSTDHVAMIRQSIENGWTGLFDLKTNGKPANKPTNYLAPEEGKYDKYT